jgi:PAS domain S-box-containing protein
MEFEELALSNPGKPKSKSSGKSRGHLKQGIARDITGRQGVEAQLKEAHERAIWLARLLEENPNPIMRVSVDGTVLYCNPASAKLHGWECKVGRVLRDQLFSLINRAIVERKEVQEDVRLGERSYIISVVPLLAEGYVNIYGRDITARKHAEESLKDSGEGYRPLFEHMLDGFAYCQMVFDKDGHSEDFIYLAVNNAFERLTGLKDVIGKRVTEIIPRIKELNPELLDIYGHVALTGKAERFEIDFKPLSLYLLVSVYSSAKGYFVAIFEDISERKRAEEGLRKYRDELEMRIQKRTEELATMNEELRAENEERMSRT